MKLIPLTQGKFAQVDDDVYEYLIQWKWYALKKSNTYYARRDVKCNGKTIAILLHREVMNTLKGYEVDHIDHDGLNCQKYNMRNCTHSQNGKNTSPRGASGYLGVTYFKGKIRAQININGNVTYLGQFGTEELAAKAYDKMAQKHYGEYANLNYKS